MAIYLYPCETCNIVHYLEFKMGEAKATVTCPRCENTCKRKFTAPAIIYNGKGFYSTDSS